MAAEEKLTDLERGRVNNVGKRIMKWTLWATAAVLACLGGAIWFGDWRLVGIASLLFLVALALLLTHHALVSPKNEARWAEAMRASQRAKKAKEDQARQRIEDLERDLFGAEG